MLDKLIESKNTAGNESLRLRLLTATFFVVLTIFSGGMVLSLYSQDLLIANDSLNISTLIAAPAIPQQKPPQPQNRQDQARDNTASNLMTRRENIQRVSESPARVPDKISTTKLDVLTRPNDPFILGREDSPPRSIGSLGSGAERCGNCADGALGINTGKDDAKPSADAKEKTIPKPPPVLPKIKKKDVVVTKSVVNGEAKYLAKPLFPTLAKSMGLNGRVSVQILIDENGNVVSANAINGHKVFIPHAVRAARSSKFSPTFLGDQKVKVRGVIIYNFSNFAQ